jgi:hypothetical protein
VRRDKRIEAVEKLDRLVALAEQGIVVREAEEDGNRDLRPFVDQIAVSAAHAASDLNDSADIGIRQLLERIEHSARGYLDGGDSALANAAYVAMRGDLDKLIRDLTTGARLTRVDPNAH